MGLEDFLAVVLGVRTADALDQRRRARQAQTDSHFDLQSLVNDSFVRRKERDRLREDQPMEAVYEAIEDVINDDLGLAIEPGSKPQELLTWGADAHRKLAGYQIEMRTFRGISPEKDHLIEQIDNALEAYLLATQTLIGSGPHAALKLMSDAQGKWHAVQRTVMSTDPARSLLRNTAQMPATHASTPPSPAITDVIQQLATLRDGGVITDEEFSTKKRELLERL
jgi:Short C-terminal domain